MMFHRWPPFSCGPGGETPGNSHSTKRPSFFGAGAVVARRAPETDQRWRNGDPDASVKSDPPPSDTVNGESHTKSRADRSKLIQNLERLQRLHSYDFDRVDFI